MLYNFFDIGFSERRLIHARAAFGNRKSSAGVAANAAASRVAAAGGSRTQQVTAGRAAAATVNKNGVTVDKGRAIDDARNSGDTRDEGQMFDSNNNYIAPPPPKLKDLKVFGSSFTDQMLGMINSMPTGATRDKAISYYSQFKQLKPEEQEKYVNSLFSEAQNAVAPIYEQDAQRIAQDYQSQKSRIEMEKNHLQDDYNLLKEVVDFNRLNDVAKTNKVLATTIRTISSPDFVRSVVPQGLTSLRGASAFEDNQQGIFDINTTADQRLRSAKQTLDQTLESEDLSLTDLNTLKGRSDTDLAQKRAGDERSLFLSLFGNEAALGTQQALGAIPTGADLLNMDSTGKKAAASSALSASDAALQKKLSARATTMTPTVAARFKQRVQQTYKFMI